MVRYFNKIRLKIRIHAELAYILLVLALYTLILHPFLFNQDIYGWGTDIYGHLYKIWKVMNYGYIEWTKDWYAGFPPFRFYPPLSYLIAAGIGKIFNSDIVGFKITVLLAMIIGAYGIKFLLKELEIREELTYFSSILYPIYPFFASNVMSTGNFPRYIALMFAPLLVLGFLYIFRYKDIKKLLLSSLFISSVILMHHNTTFVFIFLIIGMFPYFIISRKLFLRDIFKNILVVGLFLFLLTLFWTIPFISELKYSEFIDENSNDFAFRIFSVRIKEIIDINSLYYIGVSYLLIGILGDFVYLLNNNLKKRVFALSTLVLILLSFLLASGYYSPVSIMNKSFLLNKIPPYRFLDYLGMLLIISSSILVNEILNIYILTKKKVILYFLLLMIFVLILDSALFSYSRIKNIYLPKEILIEYQQSLDAYTNIRTEKFQGNLFQPKVEYLIESALTYYPLITNKITILDGWYRQGIFKTGFRIIDTYNILESDNISDYSIGSLEARLILQNVKCILVYKDKTYLNVIDNLKNLRFDKKYESHYFELWCWNKNSFVTPKHYQLIREYKIGRLFAVVGNPLIIKYFNISVDYYESLDDLAKVENIFAYKIIFLYDYGDYSNQSVWSKLEEFVRRGGILVIDTFRSKDMYSRVFNVSSHVVRIEKERLLSEKYDVTRFDEFSREFDWYATVYSGSDLKPIIKYVVPGLVKNEEYVAVGYKTIGYGHVFFVGLNLPHHIEYTGNEYERFVLRDIVGRFVPLIPDIVDYEILEYRDGKIRAIVNTRYDTWVLIAQSYFPGWIARLNGVEIPVHMDPIYGLIELYIPEGAWILELEFVDRWLWLKYVSFSTFVAMIIALLTPAIKRLLNRLFSVAV